MLAGLRSSGTETEGVIVTEKVASGAVGVLASAVTADAVDRIPLTADAEDVVQRGADATPLPALGSAWPPRTP